VKQKAEANLKACKALVEKSLIDPAASRLYYALFQAGIHVMEAQGKSPGDLTLGATQWTHGRIRDGAALYRGRREDKAMFNVAYYLRERADYRKQPVRRNEVTDLLPTAEAFLQETCR
jgi:uncharacterized protein (UPF0332 family)